MKRLLNCTASDFAQMNKEALLQAMKASEGRTMMSEVVCASAPMYPELTNAEFVAAFGADLILLNVFDVNHPNIMGMPPVEPEETIRKLKELLGRPVGINLEPVDESAHALEQLDELPSGRRANDASFLRAKELGFDFICLTGNPKTGVSNKEIERAIVRAKKTVGDDLIIIAGKMHAAGITVDTQEGLADTATVASFAKAGADVILLPGVGSVPGSTLDKTSALIRTAEENGALALTTIGTSQEGAEKETIQQMALYNKMAGATIHHIGDAGLHGIAVPENILTYSIAIRGRRHTYIRMAASINR